MIKKRDIAVQAPEAWHFLKLHDSRRHPPRASINRSHGPPAFDRWAVRTAGLPHRRSATLILVITYLGGATFGWLIRSAEIDYPELLA